MKKLIVSVVMLLCLMGCDVAASSMEKPTYTKDERTQLCFAEAVYVAANVPCTPEVERLIINSK